MAIPLFADVTHQVTFGGSDRIIEDYINNTYNMAITITFTGDDRTAYEGGEATLQIAWAVGDGTLSSFADCARYDNRCSIRRRYSGLRLSPQDKLYLDLFPPPQG